jgi:hypothetical protein
MDVEGDAPRGRVPRARPAYETHLKIRKRTGLTRAWHPMRVVCTLVGSWLSIAGRDERLHSLNQWWDVRVSVQR